MLEDIFVTLGVSSKLAGDLSLLLIFVVVSTLFGLLLGKYRLSTVLVSVYVAATIVGALPSSFQGSSKYFPVLVFLAIVVVLVFFGWHMVEVSFPGGRSLFEWRFFVMSLLITGILLSFVLGFLPSADVLDVISSNAYGYFVGEYFRLFWIVAPLVFLFYFNQE